MINTTELKNNIIQAMAEFEATQEMHDSLKDNIVPLTIQAVNTMFQRIEKTITPIVNVIQNICDTYPDLASNLLWAGGGSRAEYPDKPNYHATFQIENINGELIPVFRTEHSQVFYRFTCSLKADNPIDYGYNCSYSIRNLPYSQINKYIYNGFEATTYKAVENYVSAIIKHLKSKAKELVKDMDKLTETLRQVAGDETANEILCKNIHIGNGINSVSMTDNGVVVDICGTEYLLNVNKL
jgi:methyl-accepting chemotaxis protein